MRDPVEFALCAGEERNQQIRFAARSTTASDSINAMKV
jgi:hypothetical protein